MIAEMFMILIVFTLYLVPIAIFMIVLYYVIKSAVKQAIIEAGAECCGQPNLRENTKNKPEKEKKQEENEKRKEEDEKQKEEDVKQQEEERNEEITEKINSDEETKEE